MLFEGNLFDLKPIIININIKLSARIENGIKQLLAIVTNEGEIILNYTYGTLKPCIKRIPWFEDSKKVIQDICFDPSATWLLVLTLDSSLYIIPALRIVDEKQKIDCKWLITDLTYFPKTEKTPNATPGRVIWWQTLDCNQNAIIGYDSGEICFISLTDGQTIGATNISGPVVHLNICQDNSLESVFLLITSENRQQWRLILEQKSTGYIWSQDGSGYLKQGSQNGIENILYLTHVSPDNEQRGARSRLQGLKQLSVEKLTSLKQKLAETRSKNSLIKKDISINERSVITEFNPAHIPEVNVPEKITNLGNTFLQPQYARNRHLFSGYIKATNLLTIHGVNVDIIPLYVHKLYKDCRDILVTDKFFYIVNENYDSLSIVSCSLSESRLDGDNEFNQDSLLTTFNLPNVNEIILSVYKLTDISVIGDGRSLNNNKDKNKYFTLPKTVSDLNISDPKIDTCVLVTNYGVYKIVLSSSIVTHFMDLICKENNLEKAECLALVFGLNLQQLLELAGDLLLSTENFHQAIIFYKLSRCRLLKSVLKFAVAGHATELLHYIITCLSAPNMDMSLPTKIHLSNLAIMSYTEIHLRHNKNSMIRLRNFSNFIDFLSNNEYYDQVLAVNVLCQTAQWSLMTTLLKSRGLMFDVIETIFNFIKNFDNSPMSRMIDLNDYTLHYCLTDPINIHCLLTKPDLTKMYLKFINSKLDTFNDDILNRLVQLLNPNQPFLRPIIMKLFDVSKQNDGQGSIGQFQYLDERLTCLKDIIDTAIIVLLIIVSKNYNSAAFYNLKLMRTISIPFKKNMEVSCLTHKYRSLSAGYGHVALIRNNTVWTWGNTAKGCLGQGPLMTKYGSPQAVQVINEIFSDIQSVSCGRTHTLALTNFGVFAWGSNTYGQLGLGQISMTCYPLLIENLSELNIVDVFTGQYHSLALTSNGTLYSWGWGVHGQLGHRNVEDVKFPKLVEYFSGMVVAQVAAGHAHTLVLTSKGIVYSFGSNLFGQLGNGIMFKSNVPQPIVKLPERIVLISTEYFQNFAISVTNKLYTWGASPQVLRLQAQAQKKAKILQQADSINVQCELIESNEISTNEAGEDVKSEKSDVLGNGYGDNLDVSVNQDQVKAPFPTNDDPVVNDFELQPHLYPKLVNTSCVKGVIVNVVSGCHHAALLTKDGTLYMWGKNLDGQLGNGSRKEMNLPTPVKVNPVNFVSSVGSPAAAPTYQTAYDLRCTHIACGAEYTVAIDSNGRLLAWGNNAYGQLGKLPDDDQKSIEGKMVLLRTTKRVIKLPSSVQNISDSPKEILNIPHQSISFHSTERQSDIDLNQPQFYPLNKTTTNANNKTKNTYGSCTLHFLLETYFGFYDKEKIMNKCLELNNLQAASKISFLERCFTDSLNYQLKALETVMSVDDIKTEQVKSGVNVQNKSDVQCFSDINFSPSLESIKQFDDEIENQGGREELCDEIPEDIIKDEDAQSDCIKKNVNEDKRNVLEHVESLDNDYSFIKIPYARQELEMIRNVDELDEVQTIEYVYHVLMFYIETIKNTDNHILMQNVLINSMNFWLSHGLPISVLELILLKNMPKYLYPLSVLLFCKNFNNSLTNDIIHIQQKQKSFLFLKQLSTKFCLQLCSMMLENVDKGGVQN